MTLRALSAELLTGDDTMVKKNGEGLYDFQLFAVGSE